MTFLSFPPKQLFGFGFFGYEKKEVAISDET
jgi:hypothetical protein